MAHRYAPALGIFLLMLLAVAGCTARPRPMTIAPNTVTRFAIPRIDAQSSTWTSAAFHVAAMNSDSPHRLPADQFDAQLRMGWNDAGLLVFIDVTDDGIRESNSELDLQNGASVELFQGDPTGREHWHVTITPGVDPAYPQI